MVRMIIATHVRGSAADVTGVTDVITATDANHATARPRAHRVKGAAP